ncbi:MAG: hypothetical protein KGI06_03295 [Candidatus Micrarchaeota archaeon]|nr:hypothetical protein [Candidatus Micrarchaeota archaeon]
MESDVESYSGDSSYRYVDRLIKGSGSELMIISPYISGYYARLLVKRAGSVQVRIITSESSIGKNKKLLGRHLSSGIGAYMKALAFVLLLDFISAYLAFGYTTAILSAIVVILALATYMKHAKTESNLLVKVPKGRFIHEKMYINGDTAIIGSANLTYSGMHRNIEHIEVIREPSRIGELRGHFESLWGKIN